MRDMSWFFRGAQSAAFYYVSCTPCADARYKRKRRRQASRDRAEKRQLEIDQPGLYSHTEHMAPFKTNPFWGEEIQMGPAPIRRGKKNAQPAAAGASSRCLTAATQGTNETEDGRERGDSLRSDDTLGGIPRRRQREDETLWGNPDGKQRQRSLSDSSAGLPPIISKHSTLASVDPSRPSTARTNDSRNYFQPGRAPVNDLHPPIVSTPSQRHEETRWMLQPPPHAKVMTGRQAVPPMPAPPMTRSSSYRSDNLVAPAAAAADVALLRRPEIILNLDENWGIDSSAPNIKAESSRPSTAATTRNEGSVRSKRSGKPTSRRRPRPAVLDLTTSEDESSSDSDSDSTNETPASRTQRFRASIGRRHTGKAGPKTAPLPSFTRSKTDTTSRQVTATSAGSNGLLTASPPTLSEAEDDTNKRSASRSRSRGRGDTNSSLQQFISFEFPSRAPTPSVGDDGKDAVSQNQNQKLEISSAVPARLQGQVQAQPTASRPGNTPRTKSDLERADSGTATSSPTHSPSKAAFVSAQTSPSTALPSATTASTTPTFPTPTSSLPERRAPDSLLKAKSHNAGLGIPSIFGDAANEKSREVLERLVDVRDVAQSRWVRSPVVEARVGLPKDSESEVDALGEKGGRVAV